jgi:electron transfer flavoprotein beta subunit
VSNDAPRVLVCIKRVPGSAGRVLLTDDEQGFDARHVGYTLSPHEECAVEAAVQVGQLHGGAATVLTLGPDDALDQLREALAVGIGDAVHVVAPDADAYGPADVAAAVVSVARSRAAEGAGYDLLLFGTDAADTGDFQVGIRVAHLLGLPVLTGIRSFAVEDGVVLAKGTGPDGTEFFEVPLPAVLTISEGEILPRYPSIPGRLKAKKAPVAVVPAGPPEHGTGRRRLLVPPERPSTVEILGTGPQAAAAVVDVLEKIGVFPR